MKTSVFQLAQKLNLKTDLCRKSSVIEEIPKDLMNNLSQSQNKSMKTANDKIEKLWKMLSAYIPVTTEAIQASIISHVEYTLAKTRYNFSNEDCYRATAYTLRDRLIESLNDTLEYFYNEDVKVCYYMSLEYLLGRAMQTVLINLNIEKEYQQALEELGYDLEELYKHEHEPALGNGGLGRLAACYLDSMATLDYPCWGYGLRYTYGIFEQKIVNGYQVEYPDYWLMSENPWEICRYNTAYCVRFFGEVLSSLDPKSGERVHTWVGGTAVEALAYDTPIPGYRTRNCINLRLWKATPCHEFDFESFNSGNYMESVRERQDAEAISAVLYPNDNTDEGKVLRLEQQYFFVCATLQDILRRFKKQKVERSWSELPTKIVVQLNDTHPSLAILELMRILVDVENLKWNEAWSITKKVFCYTNHTVLPEACERWSQNIFERLLPRHLIILNDINFQFLVEVRSVLGDDTPCLSRMSIYEEGYPKIIRMCNLAVIGSRKVNGVAQLHTKLLKKSLFKDFNDYYIKIGESNKFLNVTNGVTLRRWVHMCNPDLSNLITQFLKTDLWLLDGSLLIGLKEFIKNETFVRQWEKAKLERKIALAALVKQECNIDVDPKTMLFDVHVKRIHEYKRQLLNILYILHRYLILKSLSPEERSKRFVPRCCIFGGKAASGYVTAKTIIKFIHSVGDIINNDEDVSNLLKVAFIPNYNVSSAMIIIPGADIGHHISTAGTEASGTSCIKLVLNGGRLVGTLDGANIEIQEECGKETLFSFGLTVNLVHEERLKAQKGQYSICQELRQVLEFIHRRASLYTTDDAFSKFIHLFDNLSCNGGGQIGDYYLVYRDFTDFCRAQEEVDTEYRNKELWNRLCIKACAHMGKFSSDRCIHEYAKNVWDLQPCRLPSRIE